MLRFAILIVISIAGSGDPIPKSPQPCMLDVYDYGLTSVEARLWALDHGCDYATKWKPEMDGEPYPEPLPVREIPDWNVEGLLFGEEV